MKLFDNGGVTMGNLPHINVGYREAVKADSKRAQLFGSGYSASDWVDFGSGDIQMGAGSGTAFAGQYRNPGEIVQSHSR